MCGWRVRVTVFLVSYSEWATILLCFNRCTQYGWYWQAVDGIKWKKTCCLTCEHKGAVWNQNPRVKSSHKRAGFLSSVSASRVCLISDPKCLISAIFSNLPFSLLPGVLFRCLDFSNFSTEWKNEKDEERRKGRKEGGK